MMTLHCCQKPEVLTAFVQYSTAPMSTANVVATSPAYFGDAKPTPLEITKRLASSWRNPFSQKTSALLT